MAQWVQLGGMVANGGCKASNIRSQNGSLASHTSILLGRTHRHVSRDAMHTIIFSHIPSYAYRLTHALARDLQQKFVPYFIPLLRASANTLFVGRTEVDGSVDRLRVVFVIHTLLFKTMLKEIVADESLFKKTIKCVDPSCTHASWALCLVIPTRLAVD